MREQTKGTIRNYPFLIKTGVREDFAMRGDTVRVISSAVPVYFEMRDGSNAFYLESGEQAEFESGVFNSLIVYTLSGADQQVILAISEGAKIGSAKVSGSVTLTNVNGAFTQGRASVTNANQAIIADNANRRYLLIQNNDASAVLRVTVDGNAATASQGFRVQPGTAFEVPNFCATSAINAMMEMATATAGNVEFVSA